jgi:hypothetical protein
MEVDAQRPNTELDNTDKDTEGNFAAPLEAKNIAKKLLNRPKTAKNNNGHRREATKDSKKKAAKKGKKAKYEVFAEEMTNPVNVYGPNKGGNPTPHATNNGKLNSKSGDPPKPKNSKRPMEGNESPDIAGPNTQTDPDLSAPSTQKMTQKNLRSQNDRLLDEHFILSPDEKLSDEKYDSNQDAHKNQLSGAVIFFKMIKKGPACIPKRR